MHVAGHRRVRVAQRVQPHTRHQAFRVVEVEGGTERPLEEVVFGDAEALVQKRQVLEVALRVLFAHGLQAGGQVGQVVRQPHAFVGAERYLHERLDLPHGNVVFGVAPAGFEDLAVQLGHHDDGRAHVEREPLFADAVHLAADLRLLFVKRDLVSGVLQADGGRQTADARTDDDDPFHETPFWLDFTRPLYGRPACAPQTVRQRAPSRCARVTWPSSGGRPSAGPRVATARGAPPTGNERAGALQWSQKTGATSKEARTCGRSNRARSTRTCSSLSERIGCSSRQEALTS